MPEARAPFRSRPVTVRETISLRVPEHWIAQEAEDCCTFHEQESGSVRLRLNIGEHQAAGRSLEDLMEALFFGEPSEALGKDLRLRFQVEPGWENGQEVFAYSWTIAMPVNARQVRTAEFTYSVSAGRECDPEVVSEIALIDGMIRDGQFVAKGPPTEG